MAKKNKEKKSKVKFEGTEGSLEACLASVIEACRSSGLDKDEDPTKVERELAELKFNIIGLSSELSELRRRLNPVRGIDSIGFADEEGDEGMIHSPVVELLVTANSSLKCLRDEVRELKYSLEV